jgi:hexosaminidase
MIKRLILNILILLFSLGPLFATNEKPLTIPSLREWQGGDGEYVFSKNTQLVIDPKFYNELLTVAETFRDDLFVLKNFDVKILNTSSPAKGEIFLTMGANDSTIGDEGYFLDIADNIIIKSNTPKGAFYGTRTLLQLLKHNNTIVKGIAKDYPLMKERAFFLDNGRKFFTMEWLETHIKELAYLKMNFFDMYFGDNDDFRLESELYPEITSKDHYTKADIRRLQDLAKKYFVTIVPCIDMPGHMGAILKHNPDKYALKSKNGSLVSIFLDITNIEARNFAKSIIEEYIDLFDGPYWHLGGDEYIYSGFENFPQFMIYAYDKYGSNSKPLDTYFDFVNWINSIVKSHGKTLRIFNDAMSVKNSTNLNNVVEVDKDIVIDYWTGTDQPQTYIDQGYKISNSSIDFLYYILGSSWLLHKFFIYQRWETNIYDANKPVTKGHPNNLGAKFHIWCDLTDIETEWHVAQEVWHTLRVLSTRQWGGDNPTPMFIDFVKLSDSIGSSPGLFFPDNPMPRNRTYGKQAYASSTASDSTYSPNFMVDGSYNTVWKSLPGENEWIYVDLVDTVSIDTIKIVWYHFHPDFYEVQTSNDTENWKTIFKDATGEGRIIYIKPELEVGRFVKVLFSGEYSQTGFHIWEMEIYGDNFVITKEDSTINSVCDWENYQSCIQTYPNPAINEINIEYKINNSGNTLLELFDYRGVKIKTLMDIYHDKGIYHLRMNSTNLASGEYIIVLKCGDDIFSAKVVVIK